MRLSLLAAALSIALLGALGAEATAAPNDNPNASVCKVLRKAIHGTQVGFHATHFAGSGPTGCKYNGGTSAPWAANLSLDNDVTVAGGPRGYAGLFCEPLMAAPDVSGMWLTKTRTGADVACAVETEDKVKRTTHAFFAKGRWYGELFIITPPGSSSFTYIAFLLKEVAAQLSR